MPESEQLNRDKYKFIIYHGHIHVLSINEYNEDNDDLNETQNRTSSLRGRFAVISDSSGCKIKKKCG